MKTKTAAKPIAKERTVSPRVDGKRPRLKPPALNVDEHVRSGETPMTDPGTQGTEDAATRVAPKTA